MALLRGADVEDAAQWANLWDLSFPVLADTGSVGIRFEDDQVVPSKTLLAPGGVVVIRDGDVTEADIAAVLP